MRTNVFTLGGGYIYILKNVQELDKNGEEYISTNKLDSP